MHGDLRGSGRNATWAQLGVILAAIGAVAAPARGGLLIPHGNPTGGPTAGPAKNGGTTTLTPSPALYMPKGSCPWLLPALAAQGFSAANGWTINLIAMQGNLQLDAYYPWVDKEPAIDYGAFKDKAHPRLNWGGDVLELKYDPKGTDPKGNDVRWIQVIRTNDPSAFGTKYGLNSGGYTYYIDDGWSKQTKPPSDPFYGANDVNPKTGYWADGKHFVDEPYRLLRNGINWQAQVFIASGNLAKKQLNIYDGVWWGFQNAAPVKPAPEPSTLILAGTGGFVLIGVWWRRRRCVA
jgi:hypothetical protein